MLFFVFGGLSASNRKMKGVFSAVFGQKTGRQEKENWRIQGTNPLVLSNDSNGFVQRFH